MKIWLPFAALLFALPIAATAQTQPTIAKDDEFVQERIAMLAQAARLPVMPARSISDLVSVSVHDGRIEAQTALKPTAPVTRVTIDQLIGVVTITHYPSNDPQRHPDGFLVLQQDLTDPKKGVVHTIVSSVVGRILISREILRDNVLASVQLIQDPLPEPGAAPPADPPVRLYISEVDTVQSETRRKVQHSSADFVQLRREHPDDIDQLLRPILRDLHQEATVFSVPPQVAWQVVSLNEPVDPAARQRVEQIVARLDAPDFRQRETAMKELLALGYPDALAVQSVDQTKLSPQQSVAIIEAIAKIAPLPAAEAARFARNKQFLLDVLYCDDAQVRSLALKRLSEITSENVTLPQAAAREEAIEQVRDRLTAPATQASQ